MTLCHECAAKVRLAFRQKELRQIGDMEHMICPECRKKRYCVEYEIIPKQEEGKPCDKQ